MEFFCELIYYGYITEEKTMDKKTKMKWMLISRTMHDHLHDKNSSPGDVISLINLSSFQLIWQISVERTIAAMRFRIQTCTYILGLCCHPHHVPIVDRRDQRNHAIWGNWWSVLWSMLCPVGWLSLLAAATFSPTRRIHSFLCRDGNGLHRGTSLCVIPECCK